MKKCFVFLATSVALASFELFGTYITQDFDDPDTGKKTVLLVDADKGKDAYVLQKDNVSKKYYWDKVEKNKPTNKSKPIEGDNKTK